MHCGRLPRVLNTTICGRAGGLGFVNLWCTPSLLSTIYNMSLEGGSESERTYGGSSIHHSFSLTLPHKVGRSARAAQYLLAPGVYLSGTLSALCSQHPTTASLLSRCVALLYLLLYMLLQPWALSGLLFLITKTIAFARLIK